MKSKLNIEETKNTIISELKNWFALNGGECKAIVMLSGGKDSTIVAKLCVEALGKEKVIGVSIPDKGQTENDADKIAEWLGIEYHVVPIGMITELIHNILCNSIDVKELSAQSTMNIPPRLRMLIGYAISQTFGGRVIGTCNASENYVGYLTRWGDGASDYEPIADLTMHEVLDLGDALGIPYEWVHKLPDDGLPGSESDDKKFAKQGFSYALLDKYILEGTSGDKTADEAIERMHKKNAFKLKMQDYPKFH